MCPPNVIEKGVTPPRSHTHTHTRTDILAITPISGLAEWIAVVIIDHRASRAGIGQLRQHGAVVDHRFADPRAQVPRRTVSAGILERARRRRAAD